MYFPQYSASNVYVEPVVIFSTEPRHTVGPLLTRDEVEMLPEEVKVLVTILDAWRDERVQVENTD